MSPCDVMYPVTSRLLRLNVVAVRLSTEAETDKMLLAETTPSTLKSDKNEAVKAVERVEPARVNALAELLGLNVPIASRMTNCVPS